MKRILTFALAALMLLSLAACNNSSSGGGSTPTPAPPEKPKLIMGTNAFFPPYEFYGGDDIVGIDPEIAAAIADKLGMELVIEDMEFTSLLVALTTDKIDIAMAGMTVTEKRLETVNFSASYARGIQAIIVRDGSDITGPDDLDGKKIGVQLSTTGDIYASDDYGEDNVERYDKGAAAILALKQGLVDCVIIDIAPAQAFVAANEGLKVLDTEYTLENYAIAIKKENTELLQNINAALAELIADGTVQSIIDKYITSD